MVCLHITGLVVCPQGVTGGRVQQSEGRVRQHWVLFGMVGLQQIEFRGNSVRHLTGTNEGQSCDANPHCTGLILMAGAAPPNSPVAPAVLAS